VGSELARVYQTTASLNTQTGSQNSLNTSLGLITASIYGEITSINNVFSGVSSVTGAYAVEFGSINSHILKQATQTGSQESMNTTLSIVTGSMRAEIGGIEAYTASLKSAIIVNGTNVRIIGELTASRIYTEFITSSVLFVTGSNIIGDQSTDKHEFTGSVHINDTLFIKGIAQGTGELNAFTGSQINKDSTLSVVTSSLNSTTASLIGITNELMSYTASLKGAAIVSSSQQITNYYKFAETASANTFYGDQTITGSLAIKDSETDFLIEGNGFSQTYLTSNGAIILNPGYGGVEMVGSYRTFKATDITADGTLIVKGSTTLGDDSADTTIISGSLKVSGPLRGNTISGGLDVNGGITGSVKGNLDGVAAYATTIVVANSGTTTDTSLFPTFTLSPVLASYTSLYSHASSSFFLNGVTRRVHMEGFVVSGSNNTAEISGSLIVTGSSTITGSLNISGSINITSGSITMPHRPAFRLVGDGGTIIAPYRISGSRVTMDYNQGNHYNPTNGEFTAPIAGLYQVNVVGRTNSNSLAGISQIIVEKLKASDSSTSTQIMIEWGNNTSANHIGGSTISQLEVGDKLYAWVGAGAISFDGNDNFSVAYIG
jgi:hypothetical protein